MSFFNASDVQSKFRVMLLMKLLMKAKSSFVVLHRSLSDTSSVDSSTWAESAKMTQGRIKIYVIKKKKKKKRTVREGEKWDWEFTGRASATALIALLTTKNVLSLSAFASQPLIWMFVHSQRGWAWAILCGCVPHVRMNKEIWRWGGGGARRTTVHSPCIIHGPALSHNLCSVH